MKKIFKNIIKWIVDDKDIIEKIIFFLFFSCHMYFVLKGYVHIYILIYSLIILIFITFLKYIVYLFIDFNWLGIDNDEKNTTIAVIMSFVDWEIFYKNPWLLKIIYYILYYFPTNWIYLFIMWVERKWWSIR